MTEKQFENAISWVIGVSACVLVGVAAVCAAALAIRLTLLFCCL